MNKIIFLFLILSTVILLLPSKILADGGMYRHIITYEKDEWVPINQDEQVCTISYENGKETMIISVKGELEGNETVWIFPVPTKPEKTTIAIIDEFPEFSGYEVKSKVGYEMHEKIPVFALTQVYPIVFYSVYTFSFSAGLGGKGYGTGLEEDTGVTIHEHLEKAGLTAELITTKDENALNDYLKEKNLDLPDESLSLIREYIGKDYSFVISWISDVTKYKQETGGNVLGIKTEFSAGEIYYPLKLTSIYGERKIPVLIYVSGHVSPKIYDEIKDVTKVNYYSGDKQYTKIKINAKSNLFIEDLWIGSFAPPEILFADFILLNPIIFLIIVFALLSCAASILSGFIVFKREVSLNRLGLIGLSNFLTLIGFTIATSISIKEKRKEKNKSYLKFFYLLLGLTVLLFILAFIVRSGGLLLIAILILFLSIITGMLILATSSGKKFGFIVLFSIIFLILTGLFYYYMVNAYPYKVSYGPGECRPRAISWCTTCKTVNWSAPAYPIDEGLAECFSRYFGIDLEADSDCTSVNVKEACAMIGVS